LNICLVAFYSRQGNNSPDNPLARLSELIRVVEPLAEEIYVITAEIPEGLLADRKIHLTQVNFFGRGRLLLSKALREFAVQAKIFWHLLRVLRHIEYIFWGTNAGMLVLPMALARLSRKKSILYVAGIFSKTKGLKSLRGLPAFREFILSQIARFLENGCYSLVDLIFSNAIWLLEESRFDRYRNKIFPSSCPVRFIDTNLFKQTKSFKQRARRIGCVGRLSEEKGVMNLVKAMPLVLERDKSVTLTILGEGPQYEELAEMVDRHNLANVVNFAGWVPRDELPEHLNEMRLLVLPSFTEGLPTSLREAMACGTPVLAAPVGGVLELVRDRETGFILEDNSPETIARAIIEALSYPSIDEITRKARLVIENEYNYEAIVERLRHLFASLK